MDRAALWTKLRRGRPRLLTIALGLTVAALAAVLVAAQLPPGETVRAPLTAGWWEFGHALAALLALTALAAWAWLGLAAVVRWNADFAGY